MSCPGALSPGREGWMGRGECGGHYPDVRRLIPHLVMDPLRTGPLIWEQVSGHDGEL